MNIAVLACGPSLKQNWSVARSADYDLIIGVNTAGWLFPVDWLAFTDTHIIEPIRAGRYDQPLIGYITNTGQDTPEDRARILLPLYHRHLSLLTPELIALAEKQGMSECAYTFPNALHMAQQWADKGQIDVFGFDCSPQSDAAGVAGDHSRNRWLTELPWIRSQWGQNVRAIGLSPTVASWLNHEVPWLAVEAVMSW